MAISGNQLRAARALAGLDQQQLAVCAHVGVNTIRNMEASRDDNIRARTETLDDVVAALNANGIEFTNRGGVGLKENFLRIHGRPPWPRPFRKGDTVRFLIGKAPDALEDWPRAIGVVTEVQGQMIVGPVPMLRVRFEGLDTNLWHSPGEFEFA
jgi:transcriptional regulator with XRE-family HTH domain